MLQSFENYKIIYEMVLEKEDYFHLHHGANYIEGDDREFTLHYHDAPEIYIYLSGRANFLIEGTTFRLNPYDIILVPPHTLHQPQPFVGEFFERYVVNIFPNFYRYMDCPEYEDIFLNLSDFKYKIPGYIVKRSKIMQFIDFFKNEFNKNSPYMKPLATSKILELLYCLNTINHFEGFDLINEVTQSIIDFIDLNFKNIYELEDVTSQFHYSKNYLGYLFKKSTGITIMRYINAKKMENVEKLYKSGKSDAAEKVV